MLSLSSLIDFLLSLLRDEDAQAEFDRDPQAMLARHNLDGVTAQDVRDVQPMLADCDGVSYRGSSDGGGSSGGGYSGGGSYSAAGYSGAGHSGGGHPSYQHDDDPVRVIHHVQKSHHVEREVIVKHENHYTTQEIEYKQYNTELHYTDNSVHVAEGGVYIKDSFNQDNDGIDLKDADLVDSNIVIGDENAVENIAVTTEETTTVTDSFNEDDSETVVVVDSGNDNSTTVQDTPAEPVEETVEEIVAVVPADSSASVQQAPVESVNDSYSGSAADSASSAPEPAVDPAAA